MEARKYIRWLTFGRKLFLWKDILLLPVSVAMVLWICVKAGDVKGIFAQPATVSGLTRVWLWLSTFSGITNLG